MIFFWQKKKNDTRLIWFFQVSIFEQNVSFGLLCPHQMNKCGCLTVTKEKKKTTGDKSL